MLARESTKKIFVGDSPDRQDVRRRWSGEDPGRDRGVGMGQACHAEGDSRPNLDREADAVACSRHGLGVGTLGACSGLAAHRESTEGRSG